MASKSKKSSVDLEPDILVIESILDWKSGLVVSLYKSPKGIPPRLSHSVAARMSEESWSSGIAQA